MYKLAFTPRFVRRYKKLVRRNKQLKKILNGVFEDLAVSPFAGGLRTHKIDDEEFGRVYSSRVTDDLRIKWKFEENGEVLILLLQLGGHSGKYRIYR